MSRIEFKKNKNKKKKKKKDTQSQRRLLLSKGPRICAFATKIGKVV